MTAQFVQFLLAGLTIGAIYALVALGFAIIYNASQVINFAQGEFVMIGGMATVWLANLGRKSFQYSWTIFFLMNAVIVIAEKSSWVEIPLPRIIKKLLTFGWLIGSIWLAFTINDLFH